MRFVGSGASDSPAIKRSSMLNSIVRNLKGSILCYSVHSLSVRTVGTGTF